MQVVIDDVALRLHHLPIQHPRRHHHLKARHHRYRHRVIVLEGGEEGVGEDGELDPIRHPRRKMKLIFEGGEHANNMHKRIKRVVVVVLQSLLSVLLMETSQT